MDGKEYLLDDIEYFKDGKKHLLDDEEKAFFVDNSRCHSINHNATPEELLIYDLSKVLHYARVLLSDNKIEDAKKLLENNDVISWV